MSLKFVICVHKRNEINEETNSGGRGRPLYKRQLELSDLLSPAFGLFLFPAIYPRLTAWAEFFRRFAA